MAGNLRIEWCNLGQSGLAGMPYETLKRETVAFTATNAQSGVAPENADCCRCYPEGDDCVVALGSNPVAAATLGVKIFDSATSDNSQWFGCTPGVTKIGVIEF